MEKIKAIGWGLLGIAVMIAMGCVAWAFLRGGLWAAEHVLPMLINIGCVVLAVDLLLLLPLALFRGMRPISGWLIFGSSYLFGLITWFFGLITTYTLWGVWAVVVGLFMLGGGVVPIGMLAAMVKGQWDVFFWLLGMIVLTIAARLIGMKLASQPTPYPTTQ